MVDQMESSWLVQRLEKPRVGNSLLGKDNPFSFGGGYKNGGLSDDAMDLIRGIFAFDYMGAAEYEWGAVPEALNMIAKAAQAGTLVADTITVDLADVPEPWRSRKDKNVKEFEGEATIYLLAQTDHMDEVKRRVLGWATGEGDRLRDPTQIKYSLKPYDEWDLNRCGWLELDNGFMFFTDKDMWWKTCQLFGVEV